MGVVLEPTAEMGNWCADVGAPDSEALRGFVRECAALFVDPALATTIANQVTANYEHWRHHGELCVLLEGADAGEVTVDDGEWEVEWTPVNEERTRFEAVLPPVRVGIVSQLPNGEWSWAIRSSNAIRSNSVCLDDSSGNDTYATGEDAMRAVLHPDEAHEDRWYGPSVREPRHGVTYPGGPLRLRAERAQSTTIPAIVRVAKEG